MSGYLRDNMGCVFVINDSDVALPAKLDLGPDEKFELEWLERRSQLTGVKNGMAPLNPMERERFDAFKQAQRDEFCPHIGGVDFPFAPKQCYRQFLSRAKVLVEQNPTRLRILRDDEPMPADAQFKKVKSLPEIQQEVYLIPVPERAMRDEGMIARVESGGLNDGDLVGFGQMSEVEFRQFVAKHRNGVA